MKKLKSYLIAGLLIWLPVALTVWIIHFLLSAIDNIAPAEFSLILFGRNIPGLGILLVFVTLLATGIIAKNIFGQTIIHSTNKILLKIPIVNTIYKGIKQVSDTVLNSNSNSFRKALLVQFPNSESWTIAFITGSPTIFANSFDYVNVYVPTTPNPTSGYFLIVKKEYTKELNMSVDQALRYIISMGAVDKGI